MLLKKAELFIPQIQASSSLDRKFVTGIRKNTDVITILRRNALLR